MRGFQYILIAVRSPVHDRNAIAKGISLALATNARAHVLLLTHDASGLESWQLALPSLKDIHEEEARTRRRALKMIEGVVAAQCEGSAVIPVTVADGPPQKEILRFVKDHAVDLLIMSAHAESGFEQHLFGKLNEEMHRKLPCSVLFVKQEPTALRQFACLKGNRLEVCELVYE